MVPKGFLFNALSAGIKGEQKLDLGLIYCPEGAACAGVFTKNLVQAAPVIWGREKIKVGKTYGILVNSGCANACTGKKGLEDVQEILEALSKELGLSQPLILPASTGVIGERLPTKNIINHLNKLCKELSPQKYNLVAKAMMTTDTFPKVVIKNFSLKDKEGTIMGLAKGAGMIAPDMATMLAFILSDISISSSEMQKILRESVEKTFNRISVDGDTSTNDTVYFLSSGKGEITVDSNQALNKIQKFLENVCQELAYLLIKDGEGATKVVQIYIKGASSKGVAKKIAQVVANSLLVKTAFFGEDPNWGRILAAMGRSGVLFDPSKIDIYIEDIKIVEKGLGLGKEQEKKAQEKMKKKEFKIKIDLNEGSYEYKFLTCDLSYEYVKINAEYRT